MIKEEYKNGCRLKEQVKYNIDYDDCQILNLTCANYIYDLVQESSKYETKLETEILSAFYWRDSHEGFKFWNLVESGKFYHPYVLFKYLITW